MTGSRLLRRTNPSTLSPCFDLGTFLLPGPPLPVLCRFRPGSTGKSVCATGSEDVAGLDVGTSPPSGGDGWVSSLLVTQGHRRDRGHRTDGPETKEHRSGRLCRRRDDAGTGKTTSCRLRRPRGRRLWGPTGPICVRATHTRDLARTLPVTRRPVRDGTSSETGFATVARPGRVVSEGLGRTGEARTFGSFFFGT